MDGGQPRPALTSGEKARLAALMRHQK